mmetsp:Transcript_41397/g.119132  ORF Transcript_41397/g.119132 Transcript_41397/m.119132 type:complete len:273 (-) Transcript_41397:4435-5253(-)
MGANRRRVERAVGRARGEAAGPRVVADGAGRKLILARSPRGDRAGAVRRARHLRRSRRLHRRRRTRQAPATAAGGRVRRAPHRVGRAQRVNLRRRALGVVEHSRRVGGAGGRVLRRRRARGLLGLHVHPRRCRATASSRRHWREATGGIPRGAEGRAGEATALVLLVFGVGRHLDLACLQACQGVVRARVVHRRIILVAWCVGVLRRHPRRRLHGRAHREQLLLHGGRQDRCGAVQGRCGEIFAGVLLVVHVDFERSGADGARLAEHDVLRD